MQSDHRPVARLGRRTVIALAALQWVLLTIALGALVVHTDRSLEGLLGLHIQGSYAFFGALLIGFLLGATIENTRALIALAFFCCAGGAAIFIAVILLPVWTNTIMGTTGLENFATTRALLYFGLAIIPVSIGALAGRLLGPTIPGGDLLDDRRKQDGSEWWLNRVQQRQPPIDERAGRGKAGERPEAP
jgi:hypothetical protein